MILSSGIDMRVKGITVMIIVFASLVAMSIAPVYAVQVNQLFDLSPQAWTLDSYPAFNDTGSSAVLYNAVSPQLPTITGAGTDMGQISDVGYTPVFDMSPGSWNFNSYPVFDSSGGLTNSQIDSGLLGLGKLFG